MLAKFWFGVSLLNYLPALWFRRFEVCGKFVNLKQDAQGLREFFCSSKGQRYHCHLPEVVVAAILSQEVLS